MTKSLPSLLSPRTCVGRRTVPRLWTAGPARSQAFSNQLSERSVALDFILSSVLESPRNVGSHDGGEGAREEKKARRERRKERKKRAGSREKRRVGGGMKEEGPPAKPS